MTDLLDKQRKAGKRTRIPITLWDLSMESSMGSMSEKPRTLQTETRTTENIRYTVESYKQ